MIRSITYDIYSLDGCKMKQVYRRTVAIDVIEEDRNYIYGKQPHDGHPLLIPKKDIKEDREAKPEKVKL